LVQIRCEETGLVDKMEIRSFGPTHILENVNLANADLEQETRVVEEKQVYSSKTEIDMIGPERSHASSETVQSPSAYPRDVRVLFVVDVRCFRPAPS